MRTKITLQIDADLLREARILAAGEGTSISELLSRKLEEAVRERKGYDQARRFASGPSEGPRSSYGIKKLASGHNLRVSPFRREVLHIARH
jgi:Family of unknown function (DUF6364)